MEALIQYPQTADLARELQTSATSKDLASFTSALPFLHRVASKLHIKFNKAPLEMRAKSPHRTAAALALTSLMLIDLRKLWEAIKEARPRTKKELFEAALLELARQPTAVSEVARSMLNELRREQHA